MAACVAVAATSAQRGVCTCVHVRARKQHLLPFVMQMASQKQCFRVITDTEIVFCLCDVKVE